MVLIIAVVDSLACGRACSVDLSRRMHRFPDKVSRASVIEFALNPVKVLLFR
jgi:hypothetical protein